MCSSHATVRGLLHELSGDGPLVIVDAEASPEHLSRATVEAVDMQMVVAEPYFKSLETARRYSVLGRELGIRRVVTVANKIRSDDDRDAVAAFCDSHGMELFASVPYDDALITAERAGVSPLDHLADAPSISALESILGRIEVKSGR